MYRELTARSPNLISEKHRAPLDDNEKNDIIIAIWYHNPMIRPRSTAFLCVSCIIVHFICCSCTQSQNEGACDDSRYQETRPPQYDMSEVLKQYPDCKDGLITRGLNQGKGGGWQGTGSRPGD